MVLSKVMRNYKTLLCIMLALLLVGGLSLYNHFKSPRTLTEQYDEVLMIKQSTDHVLDNKLFYEQNGMDPFFLNEEKGDPLVFEEDRQVLVKWLESLEKGDNNTASYQEAYLKSTQKYPFLYAWNRAIDPVGDQMNLLKATYMLTHHLSYSEERYPVMGGLFVEQLSQGFFNGWTLLFVLLLFGFSLLEAGQKGHLDIYNTQPLSYRKVLKRIFKPFIGALTFWYGIFFTTLMMIGFSSRWANFIYPIVINQGTEIEIFPAWEFVLYRAFIWFLLLLLITSLISLLTIKLASKDSLSIGLFIGLAGSYLVIKSSPLYYVHPLSGLFSFSQLLVEGLLIRYFISLFIWLALILALLLLFREKLLQLNVIRNKVYPVPRVKLPPFLMDMYTMWRSHIQNINIVRSLGILFFILLSAYAFLTVQVESNKDDFAEALIEEINYSSHIVAILDLIYDMRIDNTKKQFDKEYHADKEEDETFDEWYKRAYPSDSEELESFGKMGWEVKLYEEMLKHLNEGTYSDAYLLAWRDEYYDLQRQEIKFIGMHDPPLTTLASEIENAYLRENNLTPLLKGIYLPTRDGKKKSIQLANGTNQTGEIREDMISSLNDRKTNTLLYSAFLFLTSYLGIATVSVLLIVLSTSLAQLRKKKQGWGELYDLQHVDSKKLYVNRFAYNISANLYVIMIYLLALSAIAYLIGGFGEGRYPILHYDNQILGNMGLASGQTTLYYETFFRFLPLSTYVVKTLFVLLVSMIFIQAYMSLLSIKARSHIILILVTLVSCLGFAYLSYRFAYIKWIPWTPFVHLVQPEIFDGWLSSQTNLQLYETPYSILVLLAWSVVFFVGGYGWLMYKERRAK